MISRRSILAGGLTVLRAAPSDNVNLAFIATLMDSGVEFIAVDNPHANKLTIHILAAVAQHEREMISARTSAGVAATALQFAEGALMIGPLE